jgi:Bacterial Ig domain
VHPNVAEKYFIERVNKARVIGEVTMKDHPRVNDSQRRYRTYVMFWLLVVAVAGMISACSSTEVPATPTPSPTVDILSPEQNATLEGESVTMRCVISDDVSEASYSVNGGAEQSLDLYERDYTFPVEGLFEGENTVTVTVKNSLGASARKTLKFIWLPFFPTRADAVNDTVATEVNRATIIRVLGNDKGRDLTVTAVTQPANGSTSIDDFGRINYTPNADYVGSDRFDYTIRDRNGNTDSATVFVNVLPRNPEAPTANDDRANTTINTPLGIDVLANDTDPDNDELSILSASEPQNGTVELFFNGLENRTTSLIYTPDEGFTGTDTFTYSMTDSDGFNEGDGGDTATVTVTVTD